MSEEARLREALERIAYPQDERDDHGRPIGCRCGHRISMCLAVNAAMYCGGDALRGQQIARHALGYTDDLGICTPSGQERHDRSHEALIAADDLAAVSAGEPTTPERNPE